MGEHRLYLTQIAHVCVDIYALSQAGSTCSTINHNFLAVFISDRKKVSLSFTFPSEKPNKKLFLSNVARRVPLTYKKKNKKPGFVCVDFLKKRTPLIFFLCQFFHLNCLCSALHSLSTPSALTIPQVRLLSLLSSCRALCCFLKDMLLHIN